jgi:MFS family permease
MRLWGALALCTPLLALALPGLGRWVPTSGVMYFYGMVFVLVGAQGNSIMAGFINYVLEFAPPARRAMYIGCANTLGSISIVAPLIGGWMLSAGASWPLLFVCAALIPVAGLLLSLRLVEPRSRS